MYLNIITFSFNIFLTQWHDTLDSYVVSCIILQIQDDHLPDFMTKSIQELGVGTYDDIVTVSKLMFLHLLRTFPWKCKSYLLCIYSRYNQRKRSKDLYTLGKGLKTKYLSRVHGERAHS